MDDREGRNKWMNLKDLDKEAGEFNKIGLKLVDLMYELEDYQERFTCCEFWEECVGDTISTAIICIEWIMKKLNHDSCSWRRKVYSLIEKLIDAWKKKRCNSIFWTSWSKEWAMLLRRVLDLGWK
jgi:hypothetical protein